MNDLGKIILYLIGTVILGALLASPLYWGAHWLASHDIFPVLAEFPYRRYFHRGLLVAAILLLWPTARWLAIPGVRELGLVPNPRRWRDLAFGFAASFLMMTLLAIVLLQLDVYRLRSSTQWVPLARVALSAVVVSLLEEGLFRGALLGLAMRTLSWRPALLAVSALYSILHFLKPQQELPDGHTINLFSGFVMIPGAFAQFQEPWLVLGGFTTLFLIGWILGWSRLRTGSLWMAIGLHAGWILGKMGFSKVALRRNKETLPWLGEDMAVGIVSVITVALTGLIVWWWLRRRARRETEAAASP